MRLHSAWLAFASLLGLGFSSPAAGEVVLAGQEHVLSTQRSLYFDITVSESGKVRCLWFLAPSYRKPQSCLDLARPNRLVLDYTKHMLAGLLVVPEPKRVLMIGMGAGSVPRALQYLFSDVKVTSVELDPAVVEAAARFFSFTNSPVQTIEVSDGRVWVKRALENEQRFDLIFLDAYNVDHIPEHMMTREFLTELRSLLADGGVAVCNTVSQGKLYDAESVTWASAFDWLINVRPQKGNRIIVAGNGTRPSLGEMQKTAAQLAAANDLASLDLDFDQILGIIQPQPDWNPDAPILTDGYSPANLLNRD